MQTRLEARARNSERAQTLAQLYEVGDILRMKRCPICVSQVHQSLRTVQALVQQAQVRSLELSGGSRNTGSAKEGKQELAEDASIDERYNAVLARIGVEHAFILQHGSREVRHRLAVI